MAPKKKPPHPKPAEDNDDNNDGPSSRPHSKNPPAQHSTSTSTFTIPNPANPNKPISCVRSDPASPSSSSSSQSPRPASIFTHGAGGTLSAPAVVHFTTGFAATQPLVAFQGSMNLAARVKGFEAVMGHYDESALDDSKPKPKSKSKSKSKGVGAEWTLGGRSMGARAAVMASSKTTNVTSLILVSYPLQSDKGALRDEILLALPAEMAVLFISGDRDTMCDLSKLNQVRAKMAARSWLVIVRGADHGMIMNSVNGGKEATEAVGVETGRVAAEWVERGGGGALWHGGAETEGEIGWDGGAGKVNNKPQGLPTTPNKKKSNDLPTSSQPETAGQDIQPRPRKRKAVTNQAIADVDLQPRSQAAQHQPAGSSKKAKGRMSKSSSTSEAGPEAHQEATSIATRSSKRVKKAV